MFNAPEFSDVTNVYIGNPKIKELKGQVLYLNALDNGKYQIRYESPFHAQYGKKYVLNYEPMEYSVADVVKWLTRKDSPMVIPKYDKDLNRPLNISDIKQRLLVAKGDGILKLKAAPDLDNDIAFTLNWKPLKPDK